MTCREFADFIADYTHDELSDATRAAFEEHLRRCRNCRAYLALYLTTVRLERSLSLDGTREASACGVPEDLVAAILGARAAMNAAR